MLNFRSSQYGFLENASDATFFLWHLGDHRNETTLAESENQFIIGVACVFWNITENAEDMKTEKLPVSNTHKNGLDLKGNKLILDSC